MKINLSNKSSNHNEDDISIDYLLPSILAWNGPGPGRRNHRNHEQENDAKVRSWLVILININLQTE